MIIINQILIFYLILTQTLTEFARHIIIHLKSCKKTRTNEWTKQKWNMYGQLRLIFEWRLSLLIIYRIIFSISLKPLVRLSFVVRANQQPNQCDGLLSVQSINVWNAYDFLNRWILCVDGHDSVFGHFRIHKRDV